MITVTSYSNILLMIADRPLLVIGTLCLTDFHTPVTVSNAITNPTRNNSPEIGIRNVLITANNLNQLACMVANSMVSCDLTILGCCYCTHSL